MRFFGAVGYGESPEQDLLGTGVWDFVVTEREYFGDVTRNIKKEDPGANLHDNISVNNAISIVADDHAYKHFFDIKYVVWEGVRWTVSSVEVRPPRLILYLGEVYNGPTP